MSASPRTRPVDDAPLRRPVTVTELQERREAREPLVMVTAYDHPSALVAEEAGVELVLLGDSAATTVLGLDSTVPVTVDELLMLCRAVRRGLTTPLLVADLPFGSYEASDLDAVRTAQRFVKEAGADMVKLEGGGLMVDRARAIVAAGIPVMGHLGLTPQTATALGGLRAQGKRAVPALRMADDAIALQEAGVSAIVFEAIPAAVAAELMPMLDVPTIGIGAGGATDGQVLVYHDLLGLLPGRTAKFVRQYAHLHELAVGAVRAYAEDVRSRAFPTAEHTYAIGPEELQAVQTGLAERHGGARND